MSDIMSSGFILKVDTDIQLSSVILTEENQKLLSEFLKEQSKKQELMRYGLMPMNRLLFYGASGTGKTFLSKALCNYLGLEMLYIDIARALSDDSVATNISEIFNYANSKKNCLIMLDECDAISWNRDGTSIGADSAVMRRATNSLFQALDQMDNGNVFVAATNLYHRLDSAFKRRFDMSMYFPKPDMDLSEVLLKCLKSDFKFIDDIRGNKEYEGEKSIVDRRAGESPRMSFALLDNITLRLMKKAVIDGNMEVRLTDYYGMIAVALGIKIKRGGVDGK